MDETTKTTEDSHECRETALTLTPKRSVFVSFLLQVTTTGHCDYNTVVFLVIWPWIGSEAGDDLVLIQTSLLFLYVDHAVFILTSLHLHMKRPEVYIQTRSPPTPLPIQEQVTKHTTVKWLLLSSAGTTCTNSSKVNPDL